MSDMIMEVCLYFIPSLAMAGCLGILVDMAFSAFLGRR